MMLFVILVASFTIVSSSIQITICQNYGVPILTRTKSEPYILEYECLCPFDYEGNMCDNHRKVFCLTFGQKSPNTSYQSYQTILSFNMQCYLTSAWHQADSNDSINNNQRYQSLPLLPGQAQVTYENSNYNLNSQHDIIWANDTNMFNQTDGTLIRTDNDTRTDQQILSQYDKHQFQYNSTFMGVPLTNSSIKYILTVVRFMNQSILIGIQDVNFTTLLDKEGLQLGLTVSIKAPIDFSMAQFNVLRLQMSVVEIYGPYQSSHHMTMNNPMWRISNPDAPKGDYITGSKTISSKVWMIIITIFVIASLVLIRVLIKKYRNWKKQKLLLSLEEQSANN